MPLKKYFCGGLTPETRERAQQEIGETEETKARALEELRRLIKNETDFNPCTDDNFLLRFLRQRKFNVEIAFQGLRNYYKYKAVYSGIFTDLKPSDLKAFLEPCNVSLLEHRDENDVGVGIVRLGKYDMSKITMDQVLAYYVMTGDILLTEESSQVFGYITICDLEGFSLRHLMACLGSSFVWKAAMAIQYLSPCRIKGIHVVNNPPFTGLLIKMIKRFLPKKIFDRFHFHGYDSSSLHKFIAPDILPEEFGGKQGPMSDYAKTFNSIFLDHEDYIIDKNKYGFRGETLKRLQVGNSKAVHLTS